MTDVLVVNQNLELMDSLRTLWRECIDRVRCGAGPEEWESVTIRIAELERRLPRAAACAR
jgi:hypothetical protein